MVITDPRSALSRFDPWIWGALIVALVLRLIRLGDTALWFDETFSVVWIRLPWKEMLSSVLGDNHLPLYPVLLKAWAGIAGSSPWALRLPSAICSWAIVPLTAAIAATLSGRTQARWAAWLAALSPYLLQHAQDARMYALFGALAAICLLLLVRFLTGKTKGLGVGFVLANAALLATHYYGVFFVGAEMLALLTLRARLWRSWIVPAAALCGLSLVLVLAAKYLATHHAGGSYDFGWVSLPGLVWSLISGYTLVPSSSELHATGTRAALKYLPIALPTCAAVFVIGLAALRSVSRESLVVLLAIILATLLGPFAASLFFDISINPRYAMASIPAILVLLAVGCAAAARRRLTVVAPVILVICMIVGSALHLLDPGHGREDVYSAARWLDANVGANEPILVTSDEMALLARFHWPERRIITYPARKVVVDSSNADRIAADIPLYDSPRIIYIFGREWLSDPNGALRASLKAQYESCPGVEVRGIQVLCLTKRRN